MRSGSTRGLQTREEAEQTQTQAAESIHVALRTWQDYEGERRKMMQAWADHLDTPKAGGNVVEMRSAAV